MKRTEGTRTTTFRREPERDERGTGRETENANQRIKITRRRTLAGYHGWRRSVIPTSGRKEERNSGKKSTAEVKGARKVLQERHA